MPQNDLLAKSAFLATQEEIDKKLLLVGKLTNLQLPRGFLFYLFDFTNVDKKSAEAIKDSLWEIFNNCTNFDMNIEDLFEHIVEKYNDALCDLTKRNLPAWNENWSGLIGLVDKNELALSQIGKISGYLFRKNKISALIDNSNETQFHPLKTFSSIMTGKLVEDDKIVIANNSFFDLISLDRIRNLFSTAGVRDSIEAIAKNFKLDKSPVNAIFLEISSVTNIEDGKPEQLFIDQKVDTFGDKIIHRTRKAAEDLFRLLKKHLPIIGRSVKKIAGSAYNSVLPTVKKIGGRLSSKTQSLAHNQFNNSKLPNLISTVKYNNIKIKDFSNIKSGLKIPNLFVSQAKSFVLHLFQKENRKYLYGLGIIIFAVFMISNLGSKNKEKTEAKKTEQIVLSYDQANELFNQAKASYNQDKLGSITKFQQALKLAQDAEESPSLKDKSSALIIQIRAILDKEIKATRIDDTIAPLPFEQGITSITLLGSEIYGVNNDGNLFLFDTRDNESKLVSELKSDDGKPIALTSSESLNKIYILTDKQKLAIYDITAKAMSTLNAPDGQDSWGTASKIAIFSSNLYLLDPKSNMIWKHSDKNGTFLKASPYFNNKQISVKNAKDLSVDGNIYTILDDGSVMKFSHNLLDKEFAIQNIPSPDNKILGASKIFTSEDTNEIYILDKDINRIIEADKSGGFTGQYLFDKIVIDDFVVNTKLQKIWVISKGMIYSLGL